MKTIYISALCISLAACNSETSSSKNSVWDNYQTLAKDIVANAKTADAGKIASDAKRLTQMSVTLLPQFVQAQPDCAEYINAAIAAKETMLTLSLNEIERDYHADGKLPTMANVQCYHAKDLLVHPATAYVLANELMQGEDVREQIKHEIDEVLEHFNQVKNTVN